MEGGGEGKRGTSWDRSVKCSYRSFMHSFMHACIHSLDWPHNPGVRPLQ